MRYWVKAACILPLGHRVILLDFSLTVKAAPHECVIRTGQPPT